MNAIGQFLVIFGALAVATAGAIHHFGVLEGLACGAALFVLMPWHPRS